MGPPFEGPIPPARFIGEFNLNWKSRNVKILGLTWIQDQKTPESQIQHIIDLFLFYYNIKNINYKKALTFLIFNYILIIKISLIVIVKVWAYE